MKKIIIRMLIYLMLCSVIWADLETELIQAAEDGDLLKVERLLKAGADINWSSNDEYGETALMKAVLFGYNEIFNLLLEEGVDVNQKNNYGQLCSF